MKKREERKGKDEDWGNARIRRKSYEDLEEIGRKRNEDEIVKEMIARGRNGDNEKNKNEKGTGGRKRTQESKKVKKQNENQEKTKLTFLESL